MGHLCVHQCRRAAHSERIRDETVKVWDALSGACLSTVGGLDDGSALCASVQTAAHSERVGGHDGEGGGA